MDDKLRELDDVNQPDNLVIEPNAADMEIKEQLKNDDIATSDSPECSREIPATSETRTHVTIKSKYIREVSYNSFQDSFKSFLSNNTFKVLKITDLLDVKSFLKCLEILPQTTHLFYLCCEIKNFKSFSEDENDELNAIFDNERPWLIEIITKEKARFYFKEASFPTFEKIDVPESFPKDFSNKIATTDQNNLSSLVKMIKSKNLIDGDGSLLNIKLNDDSNWQQITGPFICNELCLRFLMLFEPSITYLSEALFDSLSYVGEQILSVLLDLPIVEQDQELILTQSKLFRLRNKDNRNLLKVAVEKNNIKAVQLLLKLGFDVSFQASEYETAADIAWESRNYLCLTELLVHDSPFPKCFKLDKISTTDGSKELKKVVKLRENFHAAIRSERFEYVKVFVNENPRIKYALNKLNESALITAFKNCLKNELKIFCYLKSVGFSLKFDHEIFIYMEEKKISKAKIEKIDKKIRKFQESQFCSLESYLLFFIQKSQIGRNDKNREQKYGIILSMFQCLDQVSEIRSILQAIASCNELRQIVFEFNKIHVMDLSLCANESTSGITYSNGPIYIAAKGNEDKQTFMEIVGTLAHELLHSLLENIYNNDFKPYAINDKAKQEEFQRILDNLQKLFDSKKDLDPIIRNVFKYYKDTEKVAELIVRVPNLLTRYKDNEEKLLQMSGTGQYGEELFKFYDEHTKKDIENFTVIVEVRKEIQNLNRQFEMTKDKSLKLTFSESKVEKHRKYFVNEPNKLKVVKSNAPVLTRMLICQLFSMIHSENFEFDFVLTDEESLSENDLLSKVKTLHDSLANPFLIVDCKSVETTREHLKINNFKEEKIVLIVEVNDEEIDLEPIGVNNLEHHWDDLNQDSHALLKNMYVNFQGAKVKLEDLNLDSNVLGFLPLQPLILGKLIIDEVSKGIETLLSRNFYINREFIMEDPEKTNSSNINNNRPATIRFMNLDELFREAGKKGVVVISDIAGMGKSTTLFEIRKKLKEKNKASWVGLIDLKSYINEFINFEQKPNSCGSFVDFFCRTVLNPKNDNSFDEKVFTQMYIEGNSFILLDGFDEISPNCKELLLRMIRLFNDRLGNQLWITTRTHLQKDILMTKQESSSLFYLAPFTENDQIEFLVQAWNIGFKRSQNEPRLTETATNLIHKLSTATSRWWRNPDILHLPLFVSMFAKIYENEAERKKLQIKDKSLNFFSIYDEFFYYQIKMLREHKGKLGEQLDKDIFIRRKKLDIETIHQVIALNYMLGETYPIDNDEWSKDDIIRVGIIHFNIISQGVRFVHQTFAEYFIVKHVIQILISPQALENKKVEAKLFVKVLSSENCEMIRNFLNQALRETEIPSYEKLKVNMNSRLSSLTDKETNRFEMLQNAIKEGLEKIFECVTFFINENFTEEEKEEILLNKSKLGDHMLELACNATWRNSLIWSSVWEYYKKNLGKALNNMILFKDNMLDSLLKKECMTDDVIVDFIEDLRNILSEEEQQNIFIKQQSVFNNSGNVLITAVKCCNLKLVESVLNFAREVLTTEKIKNVLGHRNAQNFNAFDLAVLYNNDQSVQLVFDNMKKVFKAAELKAFILHDDINDTTRTYRDNILHLAAQNKHCAKIFETLSSILTEGDIRLMLLDENLHTSTVLQMLIEHGHWQDRENLPKVFQFLSHEELKKYYFKMDHEGRNIWHYLFTGKSVTEKNEIDNMYFVIMKNLEVDGKEELFKLTNFAGQNIFHVLMCSGNYCEDGKFIEFILSQAEKVLTKSKIKEMLQEVDHKGKTAIQNIYNINFYQDTCKVDVESITNFFESFLSDDDLRNLKLSLESRVLYLICKGSMFNNFFDKPRLQKHLEKLSKNYKRVDLIFLLKNIISTIQIPLPYHNYYFYNTATFEVLLEFMHKIFTDPKEFEDLVFMKNEVGFCILHFWIISMNASDSEPSFSYIEKLLSRQQIAELSLDFGLRMLRLSCRGPKHLETTCNFIANHVTKNDLKKMLLARDEECRNCFQLVRNYETFKVLIKCLKNALERNEIADLLSEVVKQGTNVFSTNWDFFNINDGHFDMNGFLELMSQFFSVTEMKKNILERSSYGSNILQVACSNLTNPQDMEILLDYIDKHFEKKEKQTLVRNRDNSDSNIFFYVRSYYKHEVFWHEVFWPFLLQIIDINEIGEMLYHVNNMGKSFLKIFYVFAYDKKFLFRVFFLKTLNAENFEIATRNEYKIFRRFVQDIDMFLSIAREKLNQTQQKSCIKTLDGENNNIFHVATFCDRFGSKLLRILSNENVQKILSEDEIKAMLRAKNKVGNNVLLLTSSNRNIKLEDHKTIIRQYFLCEPLADFICETNNEGLNVLHCLCRSRQNDKLEWFCDEIKRGSNLMAQAILLKSRCNKNRTIFHYARSAETFMILFNLAKNIFRKYNVKIMLMQRDTDGNTLVDEMCQDKETTGLDQVLESLESFISRENMRQIIFESNNDKLTCLHHACGLGNRSSIKSLFNYIMQSLKPDDSFFQLSDNKNNNILHHAAANPNYSYAFTLTCHFLKENQVKTMIFDKNDRKENIFHMLVKYKLSLSTHEMYHDESVKSICAYLIDILGSKEQIVSLLESEDTDGYSVFQALIAYNSGFCLGRYYKTVKYYFPEYVSRLKSHLSSKTKSGSNIVQLAAEYNGHRFTWENLLDVVENLNAESKQEIKEILLNKDDEGRNAFQVALIYNHNEIHKILWKFIFKNCESNERKEILSSLSQNEIEAALELFTNIKDEESVILIKTVKSMMQNVPNNEII